MNSLCNELIETWRILVIIGLIFGAGAFFGSALIDTLQKAARREIERYKTAKYDGQNPFPVREVEFNYFPDDLSRPVSFRVRYGKEL